MTSFRKWRSRMLLYAGRHDWTELLSITPRPLSFRRACIPPSRKTIVEMGEPPFSRGPEQVFRASGRVLTTTLTRSVELTSVTPALR